MKRKRRRPRRTIVEYSPKGSHQRNGVVENAHYHLEGLLRTMRSDLMEKTGVNVNVKSLLAPWLVRHCAWSLTRFAIGADGQTAFKRHCGKDCVGETACFGEAICHRIPLRIQTKMEPRWEADGVFLGKLDLSDEVIVGTPKGIETTRSFRRMTEDRQWNPETLRMFVGVPWNPRGITTDAPGGIRKRYITRALVQAHGATDRCPACQGDGQVHVPRCRKRFEDIFDQEKQPGQHVRWYRKTGQVMRLNKSCQVISVHSANGDKNRQQQRQQQHASVPEPSAQPSSSSYEEPMQVSTTPRRARNPDDESEMRTVRPRLDMSALINELCERDVPEIDWEKLAVDNSSVNDIYTGLKLDEEQVTAGRETEVKRMCEFEVFAEVNEEQARGKRIWNSAWLDSQKRPGLVRSRLVVNQVRGASKREDVFAAPAPLAAMRFILSRAASRGHGRCLGLWDVSVAFFHAAIEEEVFVRPPKNMRRDKTIWRLLKDMYGTQVASSRWQRLVRETLCDGHWKVLTCVQCVAYNETEDSLVMFHGDDFLAEGHDS